MVSICIITYNHQNYIRKAIEGVLMQKINFGIELIIGEDFSTDSTLHICEEYTKKYPKLIKLLPSEKNHGVIPNFIRTLEVCTGKYIAICEGDDYWIDPLKLQNQVDFMEKNQDFSCCFHNALVLNEDRSIQPYYFNEPDQKTISTIKDVIDRWFISSASIVFRNEHINPLPEWFKLIYSGDYTLELILGVKGKIFYFNEIMSVYRQSPGNLSSRYDNLKVVQSHIEMFNFFNEYTKYQFNNQITLRIRGLNRNLKVAVLNKKYPTYKKIKVFIKKIIGRF